MAKKKAAERPDGSGSQTASVTPGEDAPTPAAKTVWARGLDNLKAHWKKIFPFVVAFLLLLFLLWVAYQFFGSGSEELEVHATVSKQADGIRISGNVESDGAAVRGAYVWVQAFKKDDKLKALDSHKQPHLTEVTGLFFISIPTKDIEGVEYFEVRAQKNTWLDWTPKTAGTFLAITIDGEAEAELQGKNSASISFAGGPWIAALIWFGISTLLALTTTPQSEKWLRRKYHAIVIAVFVFPFLVAGAFGLAQSRVATVTSDGKVVSLGFATVFKGSYVEDVPEEWLLSMTMSGVFDQEAGDASGDGLEKPKPITGFGAPLWVLFLSVIGAGLSTLSLVVHEIADPPSFRKPEEQATRKLVRSRMQTFVEHEFYILFAPVSATFVYQLMVVTESASEPSTVAIAAFGAGLSLKALLSRAGLASEKILKAEGKAEGPTQPMTLAPQLGKDGAEIEGTH